jgi:hypothetical protein
MKREFMFVSIKKTYTAAICVIALSGLMSYASAEVPSPALCDGISDLTSNHSSTKLLLAIGFILKEEFKDFFNYVFYDDDWRLFQTRAENIVVKKPNVVDSLLCAVKKMNEGNTILTRIGLWCDAHKIIWGMLEGDILSADDYHELLFDIPMIRPVWETIIDTRIQGWYSMSYSQMIMLDYKLFTYLSELSEDDRITFYKTLSERINEKIRESEE